jgi:hypothetical protein
MARKSRLQLQRVAPAPDNKNLSETVPAVFFECEHDWLVWYAEMQYKTRGGGKCSQCRAPVRHALKIRAERTDGSTRTYVCLCTRCLVAEEALSTRVLYLVAGHWMESRQVRERTARRTRKQAA